MRILFDQGTPVPLRRFLHPHTVDTCAELHWSELANGDLLDRSVASGYEVLITTDPNLKHQHRLSRWPIGIVVLPTTSWPRIRVDIDKVTAALHRLADAPLQEVDF